MSGSWTGGSTGLANVQKVFGMGEDSAVVMMSQFRPELQLLVSNPLNFLTVAGSRTYKKILENFILQNVFRAHVQSIKLGSGLLVIVATEEKARDLMKMYCGEYCDYTQVGLLLGTRKMNVKKIQETVSDFNNGKTTLLITTSIACMGINFSSLYNALILGLWSYYQYIQYLGRPMRGRTNVTASGMVFLMANPNDFVSDILNVR